MKQLYSRFATVEDVRSPEFVAINREMEELHVKYRLSDHTEVNAIRYPWSAGMLNKPAFYAARLWEYPFSVLAAELEPGMKVADIGCGMTAFTIYLQERAGCDVTGVDPDLFEEGIKYLGHGVSREFTERTGLKVVKGDFNSIPLADDSQDRAFCISVMEHVPAHVRLRGIQEMARILKPGGRAVLTVDMSMRFEMTRPLDIIWESGLTLVEPVDMRWPTRRFGIFSDEESRGLPADVFGMTLVKEDRQVEIEFRKTDAPVKSVPAYQVPTLIPQPAPDERPLWRRAGGRLARELRKGASK